MSKKFTTFREFYPYYLREHQHYMCRRLHFCGSTLIILLIFLVMFFISYWWLLLIPVIGYGFAWIGHFCFEKNKPATFQYPLYSFIGDWVMFKDIICGNISLKKSDANYD